MNPPLLELQHVSYSPPGRPLLFQDVNLLLAPGRRLGLIGPNGAGKTSLFRIMMGLTRPDTGRILLQGEHVTTDKQFAALRRKVGLLFQNAEDMLFNPTVLEDVAFGPLNLGATKEQARRRAGEALAKVGLEGFEERLTHRLSGGEQKLVSLASVLAMDPAVLLLDEPTNGLDPDAREHIIRTLTGLDLGYVVISHDWDFIDQVADDVCALEKGRLSFELEERYHRHAHAHPMGHLPHKHD